MQHQSFEEMVNHHQNDNSQETEVQNGYNAFSNQLQHYPETHFYQAQPEQVYREYHPDQYHQTNYIEQFQAQEPSSTPFRNTETQRHRDTETQRHRDTETPRHRDTETQR